MSTDGVHIASKFCNYEYCNYETNNDEYSSVAARREEEERPLLASSDPLCRGGQQNEKRGRFPVVTAKQREEGAEKKTILE